MSVDFQLSQAACSGDENRLEQLLEKDPAVVSSAMERGVGKMNVVHNAAARGHGKLLRRLLETGGRHDIELENGDRALHLAVRAGHASTTKVLLDRGADYTAKNKAGVDAVWEACVGRKSHCFLHLVQNGADSEPYIESGRITAQEIANLRRGLTGDTIGLAAAASSSESVSVRDGDFVSVGVVSDIDSVGGGKLVGRVAECGSGPGRGAFAPDPLEVCSAVMMESKHERSELRRSLEDRCQTSTIMLEASRQRGKKAQEQVVKAAANAKESALAAGSNSVRAQSSTVLTLPLSVFR